MKIIETITDMQAWSSAKRREGKSIALVPTMGALHEGHLSLVQIAKENANCVVVSIFINPIQFGKNEDFQKYPKTLASDLRNLTGQGIDVVFMPTRQIMYPKGFQSSLSVGALSKVLCGRSRPGHFDGVTTVVAKLFHAVKPDVAIFGNKDFQQRIVIEKMVQDLNMDIEIVGGGDYSRLRWLGHELPKSISHRAGAIPRPCIE